MKKMMIFGGIGLVVVIAIVLAVVLVVIPGIDKDPKETVLLKYQLEEMYTNIPVGNEAGSYKILKLQMTIVYTDEEYTKVLPKREDEIIDFLNGYFRDTTLETVNRKNGKERIKVEIVEELIELLETDSENIVKVLLTQFIVQ